MRLEKPGALPRNTPSCSSTRDDGKDKPLHSELALSSQGGNGHCAAVAAIFHLKRKKQENSKECKVSVPAFSLAIGI